MGFLSFLASFFRLRATFLYLLCLAFSATSASITGCVRAKMWRAIQECEGIIYCDTDSIAAVSFSDKIKLSNELGDWEVEGEFVSYSVGAKKVYAFEYAPEYIKQSTHDGKMITHKTASKGVRFDAAQIKEVAEGNTVLYEPISPTYSVHKEPAFVSHHNNHSQQS